MNKNLEDICLVLILLCICALAWISVFVWHNLFIALVFTGCIFIWINQTK